MAPARLEVQPFCGTSFFPGMLVQVQPVVYTSLQQEGDFFALPQSGLLGSACLLNFFLLFNLATHRWLGRRQRRAKTQARGPEERRERRQTLSRCPRKQLLHLQGTAAGAWGTRSPIPSSIASRDSSHTSCRALLHPPLRSVTRATHTRQVSRTFVLMV